MIEHSRIKCPKCNTVWSENRIKSDFRLASFLDALSKTVKELTTVEGQQTTVGEGQQTTIGGQQTTVGGQQTISEGQQTTVRGQQTTGEGQQTTVEGQQQTTIGVEGQQTSGDCEICEERGVSSRCEDCQQSLCVTCTHAHLKIAATKGHTITPITTSGLATTLLRNIQGELQSQLQRIDERVARCESVIETCASRLDQTNQAEVSALRSCTELRQVCHAEVDASFDSKEEQIKTQIGETKLELTTKSSKATTNLSELRHRRDAIERLLAAGDTRLAMEGHAVIRQTQCYMESLKSTVVNTPVKVIKLQRNPDWAASDAVTLTSDWDQSAVKDQPHTPCSRARVVLSDVTDHQWTRRAEVKLPSGPHAMRVIKQQLWCCVGSAGIAIYSGDLHNQTAQRRILSRQMTFVHDVAEMKNGDVLIASDKGLFHTDASGRCKV